MKNMTRIKALPLRKLVALTSAAFIAATLLVFTGCSAQNSASEPKQVTLEQAEETALAAAGISQDDALEIDVVEEGEGNDASYEVSFETDGVSYTYTVNKATGEITAKSSEKKAASTESNKNSKSKSSDANKADESASNSSQGTNDSSASNSSGESATSDSSASEKSNSSSNSSAKSSNSTKSSKSSSTKKSNKNSSKNSNNSSNKKSESKSNNSNKNSDSTSDSSSSESATSYISASSAKSIALSHAGISSKKATFTKVERDKENGVAVYEIDFETNKAEYEYVINAKTGSIISWDKDLHDNDDDDDDDD